MKVRAIVAGVCVLTVGVAARGAPPLDARVVEGSTPAALSNIVKATALRWQLQAAVAKTAGEIDKNHRTLLIDPLLRLGEWDAALKLVPTVDGAWYRDTVWYVRARRLADTGRWREVLPVAKEIKQPQVRAGVLLHAAHRAIENGVTLVDGDTNGRQLEAVLQAAGAPLQQAVAKGTRDALKQLAYRAFFYAKGGDAPTAGRLFAPLCTTVAAQAKQETARYQQHTDATDADIEALAKFMAQAALLQNALRDLPLTAAQYQSLIPLAATQSDLAALRRAVETAEEPGRTLNVYMLATLAAVRGDKATGRAWLEEAQRHATVLIATMCTTSAEKNQDDSEATATVAAQLAVQACAAAYALGDEALQIKALDALQAAVAAAPYHDAPLKPDEAKLFPYYLELAYFPELHAAARPPAARVDELAARLLEAPPTPDGSPAPDGAPAPDGWPTPDADATWRECMGKIAAYYRDTGQRDKLRVVALALLKQARVIAAGEASRRTGAAAEEKSFEALYSPTGTIPGTVVAALVWLRAANSNLDDEEAQEAIAFYTRRVPPLQKPYTAMALHRLGLHDKADALFDPVREVPRALAQGERPWADGSYPFNRWEEFAATEAAYRDPAAPLRWYTKLPPFTRANVLYAWTKAVYPAPKALEPAVTVAPEDVVYAGY